MSLHIWLFADELVSWHSRISSPAEAIRRGGAVAPVALAGAIIPGVARLIVGSRLVTASCVISGWIVPGGGLVEISGVESGKAAPLPFLGADRWDLISLHLSWVWELEWCME